jgi:16S rRNA (cytosine1402-N4)-methyltransferase
LYVDCTLGGGGHTQAILQRGGKVIGLDQDTNAIQHASSLLQSHLLSGKLEILFCNFRDMNDSIRRNSKLFASQGFVDGVLMDLGVSSHQIDCASRGFAFGSDGPLDMRMNQFEDQGSIEHAKTTTAKDIVNGCDVETLSNILFQYGDERRSRQIAREVVLARPFQSTAQLAEVISRITSFKERSVTLARCFQALRIVVNDEMGALNQALASMHEIVRPGFLFDTQHYFSFN